MSGDRRAGNLAPDDPLAPAVSLVRLRAEAALIARLNHGHGFADTRIPAEIYLRDDDARERLYRDSLRPEATHLAQAEELAARIALARDAARDRATPLDELAARFGLDAGQRALVTVAAAFELDADTRELCWALAGRRGLALWADVAALLAPALHEPAALLAALRPSALTSAGLLAVTGDGPLLTRRLELARRVLAWLSGTRTLDGPLARMTRLYAPGGDDDAVHLDGRIAGDADALAAAVAVRPAPIVVQGPRGVGKRGVARRIAAALGRPLLATRAENLADGAQLARWLGEVRLLGAVGYLGGIEAMFREGAEATRTALAEALAGAGDVIILGSADKGMPSVPLAGPFHRMLVPAPALPVRVAAWRAGIAGLEAALPADTADVLAGRYVIGPGTIASVLDEARATAVMTGRPVDRRGIEEAVARRLSLRLGSFGTLITRRARFEDMVLPEDVHDGLHSMVAMVRERARILETWGYADHLGLSRGVSALFSGEPGTGKTMAASAISGALGLELIRIDLSQVVSKWVGETEKNLARIFDEAQSANAMLLFDEADSLFGKRTETRTAQDRYANLEVNYILQRMETFDGISILTTNMEGSIDPAFLRRLSFRIRFPEPDVDERAQLWQRLLPPDTGLAGDLDFRGLAERFEMTGGHIRNAIVRAAVIAARAGRAMDPRDLWAGAHAEYIELGKVMPSL